MTTELHTTTTELTSTELETISGGLIAGGSVFAAGDIIDFSVNQGVNVNSPGAIAQGPGALLGGFFPFLRF